MSQFNLLWNTFDFFTNKSYELEKKHASFIEEYHNLTENNINPSHKNKLILRNKLNNSFNSILNIYLKQINSIDDLLNLHIEGSDVLESRDVSSKHLLDLRQVTKTLIEAIEAYKIEINEVLR